MSTDTTTAMRPRPRTLFRCGVLFLLLGPLIAVVPFHIVLLVNGFAEGIAFFFHTTLFVSMIAYAFGAVPAFLTGLVVGLYRHQLRHWWGALLAAVLGMALSAGLLYAVTQHADFALVCGLLALLPSLVLTRIATRHERRASRDTSPAQPLPSTP